VKNEKQEAAAIRATIGGTEIARAGGRREEERRIVEGVKRGICRTTNQE
jgi:hypothetical protein